MKNKKMKLFELFSGYGAFSLAAENDVEVVGNSEWFISAIIIYNALHKLNHKQEILLNKELMISVDNKRTYLASKTLSVDSKNEVSSKYWARKNDDYVNKIFKEIKTSELFHNNYFSIKNINDDNIVDCNLLTYSFPCQDISIQGIKKGFSKDANTRSSLLWEVERILNIYKKKQRLPDVLIMENVSAIVNKTNINNYNKWINFLNSLNYQSYSLLLNSINFNSIQARKRVFLISLLHHKNHYSEIMKLQSYKKYNKNNIIDLIDDITKYKNITYKWVKHKPVKKFQCNKIGIIYNRLHNYSKFKTENIIFDIKGKAPTLIVQLGNKFNLYHQDKLYYPSWQLCFRLMGFSKQQVNMIENKMKEIYLTDKKLTFISGNGIELKTVKQIMKTILKIWNNEGGYNE